MASIASRLILIANRTFVGRKTVARALWFEDVGQLSWREVEDLVVGHPLEAIVRPVASTTCDLDRAIVHGRVPLGNGFPIGHECVAEVLEVGVAVHRIAVGDLVVVPWHISCGVCPPCRNALPTACTTVPGLQGYGASIAGDWGGLFSEQVRVPYADAMLTRLPPGLSRRRPPRSATTSPTPTSASLGDSAGTPALAYWWSVACPAWAFRGRPGTGRGGPVGRLRR